MAQMTVPWLQPLRNHLLQALQDDHLPQAWLVHGPAGLGKLQWGQWARQVLLCEQNNACGQCASCLLLQSGAHPDSMDIAPDGNWIKVDAIRALIHWAGLSAQRGLRKVCLIRQADRMNLAAANALLKTLEEPPAATHFILLADQLDRLPATIRSRCNLLALSLPARTEAVAWLQQASGQPEKACAQALQLAQGNPGLAREWLETSRVETLQNLIEQLVALPRQPEQLPQVRQSLSAHSAHEVWSLCWFITAECIKILAGSTTADRCLTQIPELLPGSLPALFRLQRQSRQALALLGTGIREDGLLTDWLLNWIKAGRTR